MIFAAKEAVERKAMEKGRQEGRQEGQQAERERIERELVALEKSGIQVPAEIARIIARESAPSS
jgi:predicted transposase YdaD